MKLTAQEKRNASAATLVPTLWLTLGCFSILALTAYAAQPGWWTTRSAVNTNTPNDYEAVNQGQLKQFTQKAVAELNADLTNYGGAGTNLNTMVSNWVSDYATNGYSAANPKPSDFQAMNVGQLKYIGGLIYGQLAAAGYTELTPSWLQQNTNTDYVAANIGQLKQVFDFDLSLPGASNVTATAGTAGTINLSWTLPGANNATSWLVEQQNPNGTWSVIATLTDPTATFYSVTGLTSGQSYNFQVITAGAGSVSLPVGASGTPVASTAPSATPSPGRYLSSQTITVTSTLANATIYYTTNGTDPTTSNASLSNGGQLTVAATTLFKFIAIDGNGTASSQTTSLYGIGNSSDLQAGDSFTMVRKPNGTVWTWGDDGRGQQGDNQANNPAAVPQQVPGLTGITNGAAAGDHALAVKSDGTVWAWGADDQSQGGDGGTSDLWTPTPISGLSHISTVYAGEFQGFAVDNNGNLYAWGKNNFGQLGDGTTTNRSTPVAISSMTGVVKIAASPSHTLVLKSDGTVWACGANFNGELGDGTTNNSLTFEQVPGLANVVDIAAGGFSYAGGHSMALLANGTVLTWGFNGAEGALGNGGGGDVLTPQVITLPPAKAVVAVDTKSYVVLTDGSVRCFGGNAEGEMGIGNTQNQPSPVEPTGIANVQALSAGTFHVVVCTTTGAFYGWGDNNSFKLTQDFSNFQRNTEVHDDAYQGFVNVASADNSTIGLKNDGTVWTVGQGGNGALGQGDWSSSERLIQAVGLTNITQVAGGESTAFAIDDGGTLWAWGGNWDGQLGVGNYNSQNTPTQVLNVQNVLGVAGGDGHMLALQIDGMVWAAGDDSHGELGDGTTNSEDAPIAVAGISNAIAVAAGLNTSFALDLNGKVWAWGENDSSAGQLGLGTSTTANVTTPTQITGLPAMIAIAARFNSGIGIDIFGDVWGWGDLGNSDGTPLMQPGLTNVKAIGVGNGIGLAVKTDGTLWGWGYGGNGDLGNGTYVFYQPSPTQFNDVSGVVAVAGSYATTLIVKQDGSLSGFGACYSGELAAGLGTYDYSPKPLVGIALNETPPTISITSPSAGTSSSMGTAIQFQASASASAGSITKVDYYLEGVKLGTSTTSGAWNFSYTPASSGDYTFAAVATDSAGVAQISAPVTIHVLITSPTVAIASGNNQTGTSGAFLPNALVVSVTNSSGTPLANTQVTFSVTQGVGLLGTSTTASPATLIHVTTNANGMAQVLFKQPLVANYTSTIAATAANLAGQSSASFTATTPVDNGPPAAPSGLTIMPGSSGELDLTWTNNADNGTSIIVQQSTDGSTWTTVATLDPSQNSYAVTGLTVGQGYYFNEIAVNNNGTNGASEQSADNSDNPADNPNAQPTNTPGTLRYAIIDLGANFSPEKITNSGYILMTDASGKVYRCQAGTTPVQLTAPSGYSISEVTDITEDGTVVGDGTSNTLTSKLLTWSPTSSQASPSNPVTGDDGTPGTISTPFIDLAHNVWSVQTVVAGTGRDASYYTDGFYNNTEIGTVRVHGNLSYQTEYDYDHELGDIHPPGWYSGYSIIPLGVNSVGAAVCRRTDYTDTSEQVQNWDIGIIDWFNGVRPPQTVTIYYSTASTSYILSTGGSASGTTLPFKPTSLSNANCVIGLPQQNGPYAYSNNGQGPVNLPAGFLAGSINAAVDGTGTPAYQILGNASGNMALLEMNPQTGTFGTPASISALIPQPSPWGAFSSSMLGAAFGLAQVINDEGAIVGWSTKTSDSTSHGVMLFPAELAVDSNRDGTIVMANDANNPANVDIHGNPLPVDQTSQAQPYRFWLNNNEDQPSTSILFGTAPDTVPPNPSDADYKSSVIVSTRDLEDWTRLWIYTKGLNTAIQSGQIMVGLKWKQVVSGAPGIKLARATDADGGTEYLQNADSAAAQSLLGYFPLIPDATPSVTNNYLVTASASSSPGRTSDFIFPTSIWSNLSDTTPTTHFLFEGASKGFGQLEIVFLKSDGVTQIGEGGSVWIDLRDIKEMYQRAIGTPSTPPTEPYISNSSTFNDATLGTAIDVLDDPNNPTPFSAPWDETKQCVIFVHGWYTDYNGFLDYSETMYKRLWWQGYKGRFVGYHWPALSGPWTYNSSEWNAWVYGRPLLNYVNSIKGNFTTMTVAGHSQGNVVIGSAIQEGLSVNNYIMLQAALPTACYTTANASDNQYNQYPDLTNGNTTPDLAANLGYRNYIAPSKSNVGAYYCFWNPSDFALQTGTYPIVGASNWVADQKNYKPDSDPGQNLSLISYAMYNGGPIVGDVGTAPPDRNVTDIRESMSFVARPRSQAVGADSHSPAIFQHTTDLSQPPYNFTGVLSDHSGQFLRDYNLVYPLYQNFESIVAPTP